jgi:hypothetical protein
MKVVQIVRKVTQDDMICWLVKIEVPGRIRHDQDEYSVTQHDTIEMIECYVSTKIEFAKTARNDTEHYEYPVTRRILPNSIFQEGKQA